MSNTLTDWMIYNNNFSQPKVSDKKAYKQGDNRCER